MICWLLINVYRILRHFSKSVCWEKSKKQCSKDGLVRPCSQDWMCQIICDICSTVRNKISFHFVYYFHFSTSQKTSHRYIINEKKNTRLITQLLINRRKNIVYWVPFLHCDVWMPEIHNKYTTWTFFITSKMGDSVRKCIIK